MINENENGRNFILLFREIHNDQSGRPVRLKFLAGKDITVTNLESGEKFSRKVSSDGDMNFKINKPGEYLFLEYVINLK